MCEKSNFENLKNSILNLLNKYEAKTFKSKITFEALDKEYYQFCSKSSTWEEPSYLVLNEKDFMDLKYIAFNFASYIPFTEEQLREKAFVSYNGVKILIDNSLESFKYV